MIVGKAEVLLHEKIKKSKIIFGRKAEYLLKVLSSIRKLHFIAKK